MIFFVSYQKFTTEHIKIVKNSIFFSKFLKFQIFPGKVALKYFNNFDHNQK